MKEKEKQIEEMQKIMEYCCNVYDDKGRHIRNKCNTFDCEYYCDTNRVCCSFSKKEATALYDAGYRKITDSVVLSREEYQKDFSSQFNKGYEKGSKETAEKIYRELQGHGTTYVKKWIEKQFGVEIKE